MANIRKYDDISKEFLLETLKKFKSQAKAADFLKIPYTCFYRLCKKFNITEKKNKSGKGMTKKKNYSIKLKDILNGKYPNYQSNRLKIRLIKEGYKERKCELCNNSKWLGKNIPLELHHKDGNKNNHLLDNLELLCPNCHALTENYRSKNMVFIRAKRDININKYKDELIKRLQMNNLNIRKDYFITNRDFNNDIDIFLYDYKIGIEIIDNKRNSEIYKIDKNHLRDKQLYYQERGIRILSFYEDEVQDHNMKKVIQMIFHRIGINDYHKGARELEIKKLDKKKAEKFIDKYHIQNHCRSVINYALIDTSKGKRIIRAVMSFNRIISKRGEKASKTEYELVRFVTNGSIPGGAGRLLNYFIKRHPKCKRIVSYSDNRISFGNVYEKLGFKKESEVPISYYYINKDDVIRRYSKGNFSRKHEEKRWEDFDPNLTEVENAHNHGFYRIWDCGKIKWTLEVNE